MNYTFKKYFFNNLNNNLNNNLIIYLFIFDLTKKFLLQQISPLTNFWIRQYRASSFQRTMALMP